MIIQIINFYFNLIASHRNSSGSYQVHTFNSSFYPKLVKEGCSGVKQWTGKVHVHLVTLTLSSIMGTSILLLVHTHDYIYQLGEHIWMWDGPYTNTSWYTLGYSSGWCWKGRDWVLWLNDVGSHFLPDQNKVHVSSMATNFNTPCTLHCKARVWIEYYNITGTT